LSAPSLFQLIFSASLLFTDLGKVLFCPSHFQIPGIALPRDWSQLPTSMAADKHHHRTKSQLARSILNRVSSRQDVNKDEQSDPADTPGCSSFAGSAASESNISLASTPKSSRHRPHLSTTMSPQAAREMSYRARAETETSPVGDGDASLKQSIQLFKYFEALRRGDTAAVAKALQEQEPNSTTRLQGTSILHLAIQCGETPIIEYVLENSSSDGQVAAINVRDKDGNTPLHLAAKLGRTQVVTLLLDQPEINDSLTNQRGEAALDVAYSPEIFQQLQLARSLYIDSNIRRIHTLVASRDYGQLEKLLNDSRIRSSIDVNGPELATDKITLDTGGTLLHEAARKRDVQLIQILLMNGADPFKRDRKGKLPQDGTKDEKTRHILKRSPAAEAAQRSVQEKTILGPSTQAGSSSSAAENPLGGKESREMKGYLKKWTNYTGGWKLRWFVLEDGVLSYYKHQGGPKAIAFQHGR
jgi:ankyrin repeat protein